MRKSTNDDVIRHLNDGKVWQDFDKSLPHFDNQVRNVWLSLAADGFYPFGNISLSYSM